MLLEALRLAVVLLTAALAVRGAAAFVLGVRARTRRRRRLIRAVRGEQVAERLLERAGFVIEASQVSTCWYPGVGADELEVEVRADFLVRRGGARFVAEVKTGEAAPSLANPATRRQLLEYRCAFEVDGVLLVRPEESRVDEVDFPLPGSRSPGWPGWTVVGALVLGGLVGHLLHR